MLSYNAPHVGQEQPIYMTTKKLFIIDAMAMAFRNFHAFSQRQLATAAGQPTSAVYGSAQFMLKLIEDEKPDYVIVATDSKEKTFRHEMYDKYKANRKDMPEDLAKQLPIFFELFAAMGIPVLRQPGMEADDLIGSLVKKFARPDLHCYIVSGDKDFMQLVNPYVSLYSPKKSEAAQIVSDQGVFDKFGCRPDQVIDMLAIIGDASDNVPGVHGIGDKGAAKLIHEFHTLDGIYNNIESIANVRLKTALLGAKDMAYLSQKLVTIKTDIHLEVDLDEMRVDPKHATANNQLLALFTSLEFRGLTTKINAVLNQPTDTASSVFRDAPAGRPIVKAPAPTGDENPALIKTPAAQIDPRQSESFEKYGKEYRVANTPELLMKCAQELSAASVFSFDTETTGLDRIADVPIGISASTKDGTGWYIPLIQKHLTGWLTPESMIEAMKPIFADATKLKIAHNLKFDLQMFANANIPIAGPYGDTMLANYVINPISREHGLDSCALRDLSFKKIPTSALMGDKYNVQMSDVPLDLLATYACEDADIVLRLHHAYMPVLKSLGMEYVYQDIEAKLAPIIARMEQAGIYIDAEALGDISTKLDKRSRELEEVIHKEAGEVFNIQSPKQLQVILFERLKIHEKLGLTRIKKTKSGYSTDVTVLEAMEEHPLPRAILEYRMVNKLKNTYVDTLPQLLHPKTNRIHTSFHQTGTTTGRLSSSDPNLQNIPIRSPEGREIRRAFCASAPGRVIVSADYSQIELRLLAHISDDEGLKEAFAAGTDIHTATAMKIFGVTADQVTPGLRSNAKAINFGIIYGMGPQRLARDTGVTMAEAKSFIEKYFAGFPKIRTYIDQAKAAAREHGYSMTMTGRRRPIPEINARDRGTMVNGENMAVNSPIQGSAADLIKLAMINIQKKLDQEVQLDAKMLLQVHDELVFECAEQDAAALTAIVVETMEHAMELKVPLKVEAGQGYSWLDAH